ncbi:MAG: hypothetical protein ACOC33_04230 [bacterium]
MKTLDFNQMENLEGGKFWGKHDYRCHTTSLGTYCCWDYAAFWIDVGGGCSWAHLE